MKPTPTTGRRFCPGCRRPPAPAAHSDICAYCGDRLIAEGYCPVCEEFLALPAGAICPKHEVKLEDQAPPRLAGRIAEESSKWVEVGRFADTLACQPPRIRLEAEGIPTVIDGERMGDRSMYQVATGGVRLRVPEGLAGEARIILSQTWSATSAALDLEEDWPDDDEEQPATARDLHRSATADARASGSHWGLALGFFLMLAAVAILSWLQAN